MSTSYPYLKVAKLFEISYAKVLAFIDELDDGLGQNLIGGKRKLMFWELKAYDVWREEQCRRNQC